MSSGNGTKDDEGNGKAKEYIDEHQVPTAPQCAKANLKSHRPSLRWLLDPVRVVIGHAFEDKS